MNAKHQHGCGIQADLRLKGPPVMVFCSNIRVCAAIRDLPPQLYESSCVNANASANTTNAPP